jgi:apolipoprotein N-acyltransferase
VTRSPRTAGIGPRAGAVAAAATAGAALWAAHAPLAWAWSAWAVAPLLVVALRAAGGGHVADVTAPPPGPGGAFLLGTLAGIVAYGPMLSWIGVAAGGAAWVLLVLTQSVWLGAWATLVRRSLGSRWLPVHAALLWVGVEWARTRWPLGGFAWGRLAYAQVDVAWFVPLGRVLGASGVSFVVVLAGVAGLQSVLAVRVHRDAAPRSVLAQLLVPVLLVTLVTVGPPATAGTLDVLAVQGNGIRHWERTVPDLPLAITTAHHDLTVAAVAAGGRPDLTVWPESSLDRDPSRASGAPLWELAAATVAVAGPLVAGVAIDGPDPARDRIIGAVLLDADGERARYVKRRPVPFGEYVPARAILGGIPALDQIPRDAVPGGGPQAIALGPDLDVAIAFCFETLFPHVVRGNVLAGQQPAGLLLALTNNASFRDSAAPEQHLAQSRMRAIETGRWVVHAAISGVSAVVDPDGRVVARTGTFELTTLRTDVPLAVGLTPFLVVGDAVGLLGALSVVGAGVAAAGSLRSGRRSRGPGPRRPAA